MKIPILTYHPAYVNGNDYQSNDHLAFAEDLRLVHALGFRVLRLADAVSMLRSGSAGEQKYLAFTFDDGTDFDYRDLVHPAWGLQRSMLNIMKDFLAEFGAESQPTLNATSFVVTSPEARAVLDRTCLAGSGWYGDDWWSAAVASGLMDIGNHSWDHNHVSLPEVAQREQKKGDFFVIDTYEDADRQIRNAGDFLARKAPNPAANLFAYPYGHVNDYLAREYFPKHQREHGVSAAFTTDSRVATEADDRWRLPRLVLHTDWNSAGELRRVLQAAS